MIKTLKYICLGISLLTACPVYGQTDSTRYGGIRFGVDLLPFIGHFKTPRQQGFEITLDIEFRDGWFITTEEGSLSYNLEKVDYDYRMDGYYARIGIDHNILTRLPQENEIVFWGLRIATGKFTHSADRVTIRNGYWGDYQTSGKTEGIHPFWFEFTGGIRAELVRNLFIGWNIRGRFMLKLPEDTMKPYIIPGYGNTIRNISMGFNYTISYRIPYKLK